MLHDDAIFSAGVCDAAALRSGRWSLNSLLTCFLASVCKGAKADVVFLIDGSWSIGEESFIKVVHFVSGMIAAFDVVGPSGMQVCIKHGSKSRTVWSSDAEVQLLFAEQTASFQSLPYCFIAVEVFWDKL